MLARLLLFPTKRARCDPTGNSFGGDPTLRRFAGTPIEGLFRALHRNIAVRHSETVLRYTVSEPCPRPLTYGKYVTEIRDTQKGRKVRTSLRLVVGLNRAADCVTARASNECVGGRMRADFAVSASVGIAAAELAGTWFDGKRRIFARKFSQFSPP